MSVRTELEGPPTLTPVDTPIFDPDVIASMERNWHEIIPCAARGGCDRRAEWRITTICCQRAWMLCPHHEVQAIIELRVLFAEGPTHCLSCMTNYPRGAEIESFVKVVKL